MRIMTGLAAVALSAMLAQAAPSIELLPLSAGGHLVVRTGDLVLAGQPDAKTFQELVRLGVDVVINLRSMDEPGSDDRPLIDGLGLTYYRIPISSETAISQDAAKTVSSIVEAFEGHKILVHCHTGRRAAAWFAIYLYSQENLPLDQAMALAKKAGLQGRSMERLVRTLLLTGFEQAVPSPGPPYEEGDDDWEGC